MTIEISPARITASIASVEPDEKLEAAGRVFYVYVHKDLSGKIFYVGKGSGQRAWSTARQPIWHYYVDTRLGGKYAVEIVRSNLLNSEAEELEATLVNQYGAQLVNWTNTR
jgi:hypothetical protein